MKSINKQNGFTAVELLITLFIAAAFLLSGLQLYAVIIKDSGETHAQASASNVVNDYLQRYKSSTANPCIAQTPLTNQPLTVSGLSSVTITVVISCPYGSSSVSKVLVTLQYNNPQQTVSNATYTKPQDIVNNGLVLNLDAGNTSSVKGRKSIINWDSWTVGAGGTTGYSPNGDGNSRVMDTNPWGVSEIVWDVSNQDAASDADGGWDGSSFNIDNTKMYRFSTWVRRKTIGNGYFYLGTSGGGASVLNRSDGAANGNPYFSAQTWWGNANQWYLVVGYVWPAGSGAGAAMPESGTYALDGTRIASNYDYIWQSTTTSSNHRSYLYYSTDTTTNQQWYQPRVDIINGTEPTVTELLNNAGNTWYDLSGNNKNGTLLNGVGYTSASGGALTFDGVGGYVSLPSRNWYNSSGFTVSAWVLNDDFSGSWERVIDFGNGPSSDNVLLARSGAGTGNVTFQIYSGTTAYAVSVNNLLVAGEWCNLAGTVDGSGVMKLYKNGVLVGTNSSGANVSNVLLANNYIGKSNWADANWDGKFSTIQIYNRALSAPEVQQNFNALRGRYGV